MSVASPRPDRANLAAGAATTKAAATTRLASIDALRGVVMLFMLVDHVRETFYLHMQVSDPVDASTTDPGLFFTRLLSTFCAPVFVALTGLSAWLYGRTHTKVETSVFLLKRGAFLVFLEVTFVGFAWSAQFPPQTFWLQVIWAIGISMIALAGLLHLPRLWQFTLGAIIVCSHNLLDGVSFTPDSPYFIPWAVLHDRSVIELGGGVVAKTSYPILPWIGVILLGYALGPWFGRDVAPKVRMQRLVWLGLGLIAAFVALRYLNLYGDKPWFEGETTLRTLMSFLALTKYPPSLLFLLPTLGAGALMLAGLEKAQDSRLIPIISLFGAAPMFFYLFHLYVLKAIYLIALAIYGPNHGEYFGYDSVAAVWVWSFLLAAPLYVPTRWFAQLKQRRRDIWWLKYL